MPPPSPSHVNVHIKDDHLNRRSESEIREADDVTNSLALTTGIEAKKVATYVFFDLETTGLARFVGKKNVQITEISMIAVDRSEFCASNYPDLRDVRVMHKLILCTRPKCSISKEAAELTGLSDDILKKQEPFDENTATAIVSFLSHLQKPVCLLAHNGRLFDFPLLKAELLKLKIVLPSDIYIIDTLVAIRAIEIPRLPFNQDVKLTKNGCISYALQNLHLYFFGKYHLGGHRSEGDCIALAKVCHKLREKIISWIDENYSNFGSINPMWDELSPHL